MELESLLETLKTSKYRITSQRKIILNIFCENKSNLMTSSNLLKLAKLEDSNINSTTIYRNIELLDSLNLVYKTNINKTTIAYKLICSSSHHHHMICLKCGKSLPFDYCPMSDSLNKLIASENFTLVDHNFELYGYCDACTKKIDSRNKKSYKKLIASTCNKN